MALVAVEALQTLLKKEGMDEVRVAAVMGLGQWLSYTSKITPEAKQIFLAGTCICSRAKSCAPCHLTRF
jgi:hypothetical protein